MEFSFSVDDGAFERGLFRWTMVSERSSLMGRAGTASTLTQMVSATVLSIPSLRETWKRPVSAETFGRFSADP